MQPPSIPTAQSVPLNSPLPDIPPPHMAAPYVFYRPPMQRPQPQYPPQMPPQTPPQQPPPVQQQPPAPPPQPQQPPQKPQPQGPTAPLPGVGLDDATINKLNERLNSESDTIRADAAIDFFKILEKNPGLADNPTYKPYVDAFMEKILNDPSPVVRQGGLLALELGHVKNPSPNTRSRLDVLAKKGSAYGVEGGAIQNIMQKLSTHFGGTGDHAAPADSHAAQNPTAESGHGATAPASHAQPNTIAPDATANQPADPAAAGNPADPMASPTGTPPQGTGDSNAMEGANAGGDPLAALGGNNMGGMDPAAMMAALGGQGMPSQPAGSRLNTVSQSPAHNSPIPGFNAPVNAAQAPGQRLNAVASQGGR